MLYSKREVTTDILFSGQTLFPDQYLQSLDNRYYEILQTDGNFVIYLASPFKTKNAIWSTRTTVSSLQKPFSLSMQTDGNLVMYDQYGRAVWACNTYEIGIAPHSLAMESDGNLVIYDANMGHGYVELPYMQKLV